MISAPLGQDTPDTFSGSPYHASLSRPDPKYADYSVKQKRVESYRNWPPSAKQKPENLVDAGFFYTGQADSVRCFLCGTGLYVWGLEYEPWVEHARSAPECFYVLDNKGQEFINLVQKQKALEKELQKLFADGAPKDYVKCAAKKLSDLTETDVADVFQKLAYGVDILSKLTGCSTVPVLSCTLSLSALSSMFKNIGSNLKYAAAPVEEDSIFVALQRYQDSDLTAEAVGLVDLLFTINADFGEINEQAHESVVNRLEDKFPTKDIVTFMDKLKEKTHKLLTTSDPHSARRASVYINLYFRLANLRTLVLWQVVCIKQRSNYGQQSTQGVLAMINESKKSDMEVFGYVKKTSFEKAVFHTIFNPTENENVMHFICIHKEKIPSLHQNSYRRKHTIRSATFPNIRFGMKKKKLCGSLNTFSACQFDLEPVQNRKMDDIFYMRSVKSYVSMDRGGNCVSVSDEPGSEGQWKVIRLGGVGFLPQFLFSTLRWPCKFLFLKSCREDLPIEGTKNFKALKENCLWEILDV